MRSVVKASEYQTLLDQISAIYARAQNESSRALNLILTRAYWEIGKRIVIVEQKNKLRAQYGQALLEQLSQDLTQKYGNGFSPVNLSYMRRFYRAYPIFQTSEKLTWSHYQLLSTIKDKDERQAYERKAVKENWSVRDLASRLRADGVKRLSPDGHRRNNSAFLALGSSSSLKLSAAPGRLYTCRIVPANKTLAAKGPLAIDLGFREQYPLPDGAPRLKADDTVELVFQGEALAGVRKVTAAPDDLFTYRAALERVIDGDTLLTSFDFGVPPSVSWKLRLRGIDAPELATAAGQRAKRFVEKLLAPCPFIVVKTTKDRTDKYDRYLVDVFYLPGETDPAVVAARGEYLNQRLLDEGLAVRYEW